MAKRLKIGAQVCVSPRTRPRGAGLSYPKGFCGRLLEPAVVGRDAGWDVYDIKTARGERSAYGFDIRPGKKKKGRR